MTSDETAVRAQPHMDSSPNTPDLPIPASGRAVRRTGRASLSILTVAGLMAPLAVWASPSAPTESVGARYSLAALSTPAPATVLTLEGGLVGVQTLIHFTPQQLQGSYCAPPNTCVPVDYLALPGQQYNEKGADALAQAVAALPESAGPVILLGHSQGAQVIYAVLNRWQANPSTAPDPSRVSWVSIGNPDNAYGGFQTKLGLVKDPLPPDTPYTGTEIIRQYEGWADWPDDPTNLLAVLNAVAGMFLVHPDYFNVDVNDPANVRFTPTLADGSPGNVTYVWVPNPVLPLISGTGPLAPLLDSLLRPIVESAYHRPVTIPAPGASAPAPDPKPAQVLADPLPDPLPNPSERQLVSPTPDPTPPVTSATQDTRQTLPAATTVTPDPTPDPVITRSVIADEPAPPSTPARHRGAGKASQKTPHAAAARAHRANGSADQSDTDTASGTAD